MTLTRPQNLFMFFALIVSILCAVQPTLNAEARLAGSKQTALKIALKEQRKTLTRMFGQDMHAQLKTLYSHVKYQPLWQDSLFKNPTKKALILIHNATEDGLNPTDYHPSTLQNISEQAKKHNTNNTRAIKDVMFTAALLRYIQDVNYGRINPTHYKHKTFRINKKERNERVLTLFLKGLSSYNLAKTIRTEKLEAPAYIALKEAYQKYTQITEDGGWTKIPTTRQKIKVGQTHTKIMPLLIKRLETEGYLSGTLPSTVYTPEIESAVKQFQTQNRLKSDGIIGAATIRTLNISASERTNQLLLSLERWRWLPDNLGDKHVRVNIPSFELTAYEGKNVALTMPVVVGKKKYQTPLMDTIATDITFNPYWYIPESITRSKVIPALHKNPNLFYRRNYEASYGSYNAAAVTDIHKILATEASSEGYLRIRQRPGRGNALGRARVGIKNNDAIYLHDTPYKGVFKRQYRALSHGCIRLERPAELVSYLLDKHPTWQKNQSEKLFSLKNPLKPTYVNLAKNVPVYLVYHTAWAAPDGTVHFANDVYNLDKTLISALNQPQHKRQAILQLAAR